MMSNFEHSARCPKRHADDTDCECGADLNASLRAERDALKADRESWIATNTEVIAGTVKTDRINQELRARLATIEQETIERCAKVAEDADIEPGSFDGYEGHDDATGTLKNAARAIRALLPAPQVEKREECGCGHSLLMHNWDGCWVAKGGIAADGSLNRCECRATPAKESES